MKKIFSLLLVGLLSCASAAFADVVDWSYKIINDGTENPSVQITAKVQSGYHLYDFTHPGPENPLNIKVEAKGAKTVGTPVPNKKYTVEHDPDFGDSHFYTGTVVFTQKLKATAPAFTVDVTVKGQACNDSGCVPINSFDQLKGKGAADATPEPEAEAETEVAEVAEAVGDTAAVAMEMETADANIEISNDSDLWKNVEDQLSTIGEKEEDLSLWGIFLAGFLAGLIALITPCVWPMIPMTVSFFLKQNKTRSKAISTAVIYGLSIIVIYVLLGLVITAIFGASALNALSTSALFNIIFFLLLVVFAISFFGGFELTLPSSWTNKMDSKVDSTTGLLSVFFMAFTLALVSFSCTGPIIGTLLVEAASSGSYLSPAIGMLGFAVALALPFTIFAMFPTMLKSMPKSGGWLNSVKVVLGFLELALALKFLSVADLAYGWRILDREVFVSLWIVIFALLGVYLLGKLRFPHDSKVEKTGVGRFMLALISFAFAIYMLPGLWGAPLKAISAFAPPSHTQDFSLYDGEVKAKAENFEEGMALARQQGKPMLLDFSGFGCVNCRKLEGAVWTDDGVKNQIDDDFVLVTLMVDDKTALPEPKIVTEKDGKKSKLETVGDLWSYLQRSKFGANAQPYHIILDHDGNPMVDYMDYQKGQDVATYKKFLETGLKNFKKTQEK